ncbi:Putative LOC100168714, partial [Caligus rogercresseyi]
FFKGSITQGLPSRKVTTGKKKAEGGVGERTPHLIQPKICVTDSSGIKVTPIFHEQQILLHTPMEEGGP